MSTILPIWQPIGYSTHIIASKVAKKYGVKTSHTGTLDPMAEGVIIVLLGDKRHKKYEYANWKKTYEFEVAFGIRTDSYDGLGLIQEYNLETDIQKENINNIIKCFGGIYFQKYPPFSAKKVKGEPLHQHTRKGNLKNIKIPKKSGEIYKLELLNSYEKTLKDIVNNTINEINLVTGDLRQNKVKDNWNKFLSNNKDKSIKVARFRVEMSKGLYVRTLSQDIVNKLDTLGFVYSLIRTRNGEYTKENSKSLEDIFGSNFRDNYDFVSRG